MLGILNFLLIHLDFESYFVKLMCSEGHISLHSSMCFVLHLVPKPQETFAPRHALLPLKLCSCIPVLFVIVFSANLPSVLALLFLSIP